jgi:hypothetical protein
MRATATLRVQRGRNELGWIWRKAVAARFVQIVRAAVNTPPERPRRRKPRKAKKPAR